MLREGDTVGDQPSDLRPEEQSVLDEKVTEPVQGGLDEVVPGLFPNDTVPDELVGYRVPSACQIAGITYRQLDYWARTGLVVPSIRNAEGSGTQRLYSFRDILLLRVVKRFLDVGISLQQIRLAIEHLRERGVDDLTELTLVSDGFSVYEVTSANELFDLSRGGQGMFMISVSSVWRELEGTLSELPGERTAADAPLVEDPSDELAARRRSRAV